MVSQLMNNHPEKLTKKLMVNASVTLIQRALIMRRVLWSTIDHAIWEFPKIGDPNTVP